MNSYYEVLGVPPNATEMEIRSAYGRDVLRLRETTSDKVAQFRAALDAAFTTLVDPAKRSEYDAQLVTAMQENAADSADDAVDAFRDHFAVIRLVPRSDVEELPRGSRDHP